MSEHPMKETSSHIPETARAEAVEWPAVYDGLMEMPAVPQRRELERLAEMYDTPIGDLKRDLKRHIDRREAAERNAKQAADILERERQRSRPVVETESFDDAVAQTRDLVLQANETRPHIFRTPVAEFPVLMDANCIAPIVLNSYERRLLALHKVAVFTDARDNEIPPPREIASLVFGDHATPWKPLRGVSTIPLIVPGGKMITEGYDEASGLFVKPWGKPEMMEVDEAVALLFEVIEGFPFSDLYGETDTDPTHLPSVDGAWPMPNLKRGASSRVNFLALLITLAVRHLIKGPVPLFLINKTRPGTGAGFLLHVCKIILEGKPTTTASTLSDDETEIAKALTAFLGTGRTALLFDNVTELRSKAFASILTGDSFEGRILQTSNIRAADLSGTTWGAAGNNVRVSAEIAERIALIHMDAALDRPAQYRPAEMFKAKGVYEQDFDDYLVERRERILGAVLTIVQAWAAAGCPSPKATTPTVPTTRFPAWARVVNGALGVAGLGEVCLNSKAYLESAEIAEDDSGAGGAYRDALAKLWATRGAADYSMTEIHRILSGHDSLSPGDPPSVLDFDILPKGTRVNSPKEMERALQAVFRTPQAHGAFDLPSGQRVLASYVKTNTGRVLRLAAAGK
jgi:hypothetical protein